MQSQLILSVISDDKPGVVEAIADIVSRHDGNWLESSLSQLSGKFAGLVKISLPETQAANLKADFLELEITGVRVRVDELRTPAQSSAQKASINAVGPDRKGIVHEIAQSLAHYGINVDKLETRCSSMAYSGDPIFEAEGTLSVPDSADFERLNDELDKLADSLAMDISLSLLQ